MNGSGPPRIFSQSRRVARALRQYRLTRPQPGVPPDPAQQFLRADMAEDIIERLTFMKVPPCPTLIHGDWPGFLGKALNDRGFSVWDTGPDTLDEEKPLPDPFFGLIINLCCLDTVNDLPGALLHIRNALPDDGLFLGSLPGNGSMPQLRRILLAADGDRPAARMHPQIDTAAASTLMQRAGFAKQVVDVRQLTVSYGRFEDLVADMRAQGLTNALADAPPPFSRIALERTREAFADLADDRGRVTETFEILTLTGWR